MNRNNSFFSSAFAKTVLGGCACALLVGCTFTSRPRVDVHEVNIVDESEYSHNSAGVVEYVWEEPMVDVIEVPPGLDPEGHYYRPAHHEVVEVRQGRWQYYKQPGSK